MRTRALVALVAASAWLLFPGGAMAVVSADKKPEQADEKTGSKRDDSGGSGDRDSGDGHGGGRSSEPTTTTEAPKPLDRPSPGIDFAFATYRVFATQFEPTVPGSVEVAVPDKCVKFAALKNTATLALLKCPASYSLDRDYRIVVTRDGSPPGIIPVKEAGPWNIDDNWWSGRRGDEARRLYGDLPAGRPEAQVASGGGYNHVDDCKDLGGKPTGTPGGADQFGRCVRNPAGIDLSVAAARALGFRPLENAWVNVTLLWEPTEIILTNAKSGKALDVKDGSRLDAAPVIQHSYVGAANQRWRLRQVAGDVYTVAAAHTGKLLDVRDRSIAEGAHLMQHGATGGTNQQWRLIPLGPPAPPAALNKTSRPFTLVSVGSNKVLDVAGAATTDVAQVVQSTGTGAPNQTWIATIVEPPAPPPLPATPDRTDKASPAPVPASAAPTPAPAAPPSTPSGSSPGGIANPRELPAG